MLGLLARKDAEKEGRGEERWHRGTERVMNPNHRGICFREKEINKHENNSPQHLASRTKTNVEEKAQLMWKEERKDDI